jgi:hypothetical protein
MQNNIAMRRQLYAKSLPDVSEERTASICMWTTHHHIPNTVIFSVAVLRALNRSQRTVTNVLVSIMHIDSSKVYFMDDCHHCIYFKPRENLFISSLNGNTFPLQI